MNIRVPLIVKILLPLVAVIIVTVAVSGYRVYQESTERLQSEMDTRLERISTLTASSIHTDTLQLVRVPSDVDGPAFADIQAQLQQAITAANLNWAGIYYRDNDLLYYWVDVSPTGVGYPFFYATPEHFAAFADQQPHKIEYADEFGTYYGYVAPIVVDGPSGRQVIGIVETVLSGESRVLLQQDTLSRVLPILIGGSLGAIVCAIGVTLFVFNRPLRRLKRGTLALAEGNFGYQIDLKSRDELGELAATFNTMSVQLERLYQGRAERERVQREIEIACAVQQGLFPKQLPHVAGLEMAAYCLPHRETSGDFYDLMLLKDGRLGVVVGDVSGKSIPAAMLMVAAYSALRSEARDHYLPAEVLSEANAVLSQNMPRSMFVAASFACIDPVKCEMVWANAGQIYPFLLNHIRPVDPAAYPQYLEVTGTTIPLGLYGTAHYENQHLPLLPGDTVLFYTDGVIEAMNPAHELYGFERLEVLVRSLAQNLTPQALIDAVLADVKLFVGAAEQHDDITLVVVKLADKPEVRWSSRMRRIPLLYQILIVNSAIVCLGATAGTSITRRLANSYSGTTLTVIFAVIGVILSVLVNYLLLRYALRPLTNLQATAERVTAGDLGVRVPTPSTGDPTIAQLSMAFNTMLDQVEEDTRAIERSRALTEQLTQQVIDAQEEERRRIARELHDDTAQALATLVLYAQTAHQDPRTPAPLAERLDGLCALASRTLDGVRTIIADLRPSQLDDLGLAAAIREQAQERLERAGLRADVQVRGAERRLPALLEITLYRVMQEAFSNIVKHAQASYVEVDLDLSQPGWVQARIEDDGGGFNPQDFAPGLREGRGVGLFGMHERINLLGGTMTIDSTPGVGTELRISIPVPAQERDADGQGNDHHSAGR